MRATTGLLALALTTIAAGAAAQDAPPRSWAAAFGTASLNTWPHLSNGRLGARAALPLLGRWDFYPGLEIQPALGLSQAFFDVWVTPFGHSGLASSWYLGGGLALRNQGARTVPIS
jgi:hypothetical protein